MIDCGVFSQSDVSGHAKTERTEMNKKNLIFTHCFIPLFLGGILYISFRSRTLKMFNWFEYIGIENKILSIRELFFPLKIYLPQWVYYSLPDGLWVYSFTSAILIVWNNQFKIAKYWLVIPVFTGAIIEIAQGLKLFRGTFDILDLTFTIVALLLSIIIINHKFKQNDKQNDKQIH